MCEMKVFIWDASKGALYPNKAGFFRKLIEKQFKLGQIWFVFKSIM